MHDDFGFWLEGTGAGPEAQAMLEQANQAILPTVRLEGLDAAYWVRPGDERAHLRWVRPEPEEKLLDALARLRASGEILLGEGTRYAGAFRAHGLVVPVWDLPADTPADDWTAPGGGVPDPARGRAGRRPSRSPPTSAAPAPACSAARSPSAEAGLSVTQVATGVHERPSEGVAADGAAHAPRPAAAAAELRAGDPHDLDAGGLERRVGHGVALVGDRQPGREGEGVVAVVPLLALGGDRVEPGVDHPQPVDAHRGGRGDDERLRAR